MQQAVNAESVGRSYWCPAARQLFTFAAILLSMLIGATSAHAATYWLSSQSNDALRYRTGEEACVTGVFIPRMNAYRAAATNANVKFRYNPVNIGPEQGIGERVCRGIIERSFGSNWLPVEVVSTNVYGPHGNADQCALPGYTDPDTGQCGAPKCTSSCCGAGANGSNPIHSASGNKFQRETDLVNGGVFPLRFERFYNSNRTLENAAVPLGVGWSHTYLRRITAYPSASGRSIDRATVYRHDGRMQKFSLVDGAWTTDADTNDRLQWRVNGSAQNWTYSDADGQTEIYDAQGRLLSMTNRAGVTQALSYTDVAGRPRADVQKVTGTDGRTLSFGYDSQGQITTITDAGGNIYGYAYDNLGNLSSVAYPDSGSTPKTRTYLYNEAGQTGGVAQPHALTGIVDENGNRYASWAYDRSGRGTLSVHGAYNGGTVDRTGIAFNNDGTTTVTDALKTARTYGFAVHYGVAHLTGLDVPCDGCGQHARTQTFDDHGNLASRTDFNGVLTTYHYDLSRNLETSRIEAAGTAHARTISTEWHPTYRLPLKIAAPQLLTIYGYDDIGNLLSKTLYATSDTTGLQVLSPTSMGAARVWTYTYNKRGQVLTVIGPHTDVVDKTTYMYAENGDLNNITNALGQMTTLSHYNANGRVGLMTDPNGATTALTYSPRGWLTAKTVSAGGTIEVTSFTYDGVGQLTRVTLPDASGISYRYDKAHRLIHIADSVGNSIAYTLDDMGNRIGEQIKDANGGFTQRVNRMYNTANRLQQVTGAVQ